MTPGSASRARNIGARNSQSPFLFFIDADVEVLPGPVDWLAKFAAANFYYVHVAGIGERPDCELDGTVLVERQAFERIKGYDEVSAAGAARISISARG
jgi:hypothetical protein